MIDKRDEILELNEPLHEAFFIGKNRGCRLADRSTP
jgi:hypothetical protein